MTPKAVLPSLHKCAHGFLYMYVSVHTRIYIHTYHIDTQKIHDHIKLLFCDVDSPLYAVNTIG